MEPDKFILPSSIMCGDQLTFTADQDRELRPQDDNKPSIVRMPPTMSASGTATRSPSERMIRRRAPLDLEVHRDDPPGKRALVQVALGSFRWPPYLLGVWLLVLVLTHILHCLVAVLEGALPTVKKFCQYCRNWAEEAWKTDLEAHHVMPVAIGCLTAIMYAVYCCMYVVYCIAVWAIEPLTADPELQEVADSKVVNYDEEPKMAKH